MTDAYLDTSVAREFWNGAWFILSTVMVGMMLLFVLRRMFRRGFKIRYGWYDEPGTQTALALAVFLSASALRAGWIWLLLGCRNEGGDCSGIARAVWLMDISGFMAIVGALCVIRVMSPREWLPWSWLAAGATAAAIPFAYYYGDRLSGLF